MNISEKKLDGQSFDEKAEKILHYLKKEIRHDENFLPRPFFIEFFGTPCSGKTTTITEVDKFLNRKGFRVKKPQEGAEVIKHIERTTPLFNIATALYAHKILVDESVASLYDVIIFDRCLFDSYGWMLYWQEKDLLSEAETKMLQLFFTSRFWINKIDIAYLMTCDVETAMERELRLAVSEKLSESTNPESIKKMIRRCQKTFEDLHSKHPQLQIFDTTNMSPQEMVQIICENILCTLEAKISGK